MDDFLKKLMDRLSVCLTYAGEDIDDFLWVLDEDEKEGRAPADVEKMRTLYRQIKDQYVQDREALREGIYPEDALDLAVHMVELYQAMFDYLMADDPSKLTENAGNADTADFDAMFELFRKNRELPS